MVSSTSQLILRLGFVSLIIGCLVGYLAPYWAGIGDAEVQGSNIRIQLFSGGLFYTCEALIGCQFTPWTDQSVETLAIRILIIFSGLCAIISFFCVIRSCCSNSHPQSFKMEGIFGVMSGVPGVAAVATFGATFPLPAVFFGWAFFLSAVSSGLILLTSIAMLSISLKYKKYFQSTTALGYDNQGYAMEWSSPAANAVRY